VTWIEWAGVAAMAAFGILGALAVVFLGPE
jgi:hypothetical protein